MVSGALVTQSGAVCPPTYNIPTLRLVINCEKLRNNYEYFPAQPSPAHTEQRISGPTQAETRHEATAQREESRTLSWFLLTEWAPSSEWVFSLADQFSDRQHRDWKMRRRTMKCGRCIVIRDDNGSMISQDFLSVFLQKVTKKG